ncbi:MAG TPA: hypothetical protein VLT62_30100 [Candidatus Methylomirabilis sp.]|nr:hypothetical protein [Candidatus Methylomirabilis sp.]
MWFLMIGLNLLSLAAALLALRGLHRPPLAADPGDSFARVLAAATPLARHLVERGATAQNAIGAAGASPEAVRALDGLSGHGEAKPC